MMNISWCSRLYARLMTDLQADVLPAGHESNCTPESILDGMQLEVAFPVPSRSVVGVGVRH